MVFHGSVFSTAHHVRTITNRDGVVEMLVDGHSLSCQRVAPTGLVELPPLIANGDGVVFGHHAFGLNREDPTEIAAPAAAKGRAPFGGLHRELVVG